ncbi:MAG: glycosyltransferase family 4 protein [Oscillospiraceae bacterium]|nr:glycosyltransferase family 4 protein [Oscillospiraceae bacterium]
MKKLLITSTELMMIQFLVPHVKHLAENGFHVEIACSEVGGRMDEVRAALDGVAKAIHTLRLERNPASPRNLLGYRDMKRLLKENRYDIIWTNEPVMGVVTRLAANKYRRNGTKVIYMCHGFHFFKGASPLNWAIYYPIERVMAHFCDAIVTMNEEDHQRAQSFRTKRVYKIPGVGVDTKRFRLEKSPELRAAKRRALGIPEDAYVILSVGELTKRKNHEVVLHAIKEMNDPSCQYLLCGKGDLREYLEELAKKLGIDKQVHFLGYRMDIPEIYRAADCFAFPSLQEGLPFALMEAMESGLPIVCSRIRGNVDLIDDQIGGILCDVHSSGEFSNALRILRYQNGKKMEAYNRQKLLQYDLSHVKGVILVIITDISTH